MFLRSAGEVRDRCTRQNKLYPGRGFVSCFVPRFRAGAAGASKLRLRADSGEGDRTATAFGAPEMNGGGESAVTVTASVCLPRAVAPDVVPVILAFLYTDRLVQDPDFGHDGFAKEYLDPAREGGLSMSSMLTAAVGVERCRPRGRSGIGGDSREAGSISGADWDRGNGVPSKVGTTISSNIPCDSTNSRSGAESLCFFAGRVWRGKNGILS